MPSRKQLTLIPDSTFQTDPHDIADNDQWFPFLFVIMIPNTAGTIAKAVRRHDYWLAVLCVSVYVGFFLLRFCLSKYLSLPKNEKSSQKFWLKLNMWFLYTAICLGFVYQFVDFFSPQVTSALYAVVLVCSSFLFYVFVIVDLVKYGKIWRHGEDEHRLPENWTFDAGKLNYYSDAILEKV